MNAMEDLGYREEKERTIKNKDTGEMEPAPIKIA
jgi:hypothetical protein